MTGAQTAGVPAATATPSATNRAGRGVLLAGTIIMGAFAVVYTLAFATWLVFFLLADFDVDLPWIGPLLALAAILTLVAVALGRLAIRLAELGEARRAGITAMIQTVVGFFAMMGFVIVTLLGAIFLLVSPEATPSPPAATN